MHRLIMGGKCGYLLNLIFNQLIFTLQCDSLVEFKVSKIPIIYNYRLSGHKLIIIRILSLIVMINSY